METGNEGLDERFLDSVGKVGDVGDVCGVLRRTNVEIGVWAGRSPSDSRNFSGRCTALLKLSAEAFRPATRGDERRGEVESALFGRSLGSSSVGITGMLPLLVCEIAGPYGENRAVRVRRLSMSQSRSGTRDSSREITMDGEVLE